MPDCRQRLLSQVGKTIGPQRRVKLAKLDMKSAEYGYVFSVNKADKTFFLQLTKNTNDELLQYNSQIHEHGMKLSMAPEGRRYHCPLETSPGDVVIAYYDKDMVWYRAIVKKPNISSGTVTLIFIDYGNVEEIKVTHLLKIDPDELPIIEREPFGFTAKIKQLQDWSANQVDYLLTTLEEQYILADIVDQAEEQIFVDISPHALNSIFFFSYDPKLREKGLPFDTMVVDSE